MGCLANSCTFTIQEFLERLKIYYDKLFPCEYFCDWITWVPPYTASLFRVQLQSEYSDQVLTALFLAPADTTNEMTKQLRLGVTAFAIDNPLRREPHYLQVFLICF